MPRDHMDPCTLERRDVELPVELGQVLLEIHRIAGRGQTVKQHAGLHRRQAIDVFDVLHSTFLGGYGLRTSGYGRAFSVLFLKPEA